MTLFSAARSLAKSPHLPFYRVAHKAYVRLLEFRTTRLLQDTLRGIDATPPLECNPHATAELHTLTCHRHVRMYIAAVKSLLRFTRDIAVVAHDDGSLTSNDISRIAHHIKGVRLIRRAQADEDMRGLLALYSPISAYRGTVANSQELTDHAFLARASRIIVSNSDTLFLKSPDQLLEWIAREDETVLCVYEAAPHGQSEFLSRLKSSFPPHMTLALVCFPTRLVRAEALAQVLADSGARHSDWYTGQNALAAVLGTAAPSDAIYFLDKRTYEASGTLVEPDAVFRHYWTSIVNLRIQHSVDASRVISELSRPR